MKKKKKSSRTKGKRTTRPTVYSIDRDFLIISGGGLVVLVLALLLFLH